LRKECEKSKTQNRSKLLLFNGAPVAQLDRASGYEPEGPVFESPRAHHSSFMYFVYVLENTVTQKHYTGFTLDLVQRLGQHNSGVTKSTKNRGKWVLLYSEKFMTRPEAMRRERFFRSGKGREELRRILRTEGRQSAAG
jgi:putative endonuclease